MNITNKQKEQRAKRIRGGIRGTSEKPRLSVFRSNDHIYAQIIDDTMGKTLIGVSEKTLDNQAGNPSTGSGLSKTEKAKTLGLALAKAAESKKIKKVVFDKGSYKYHGRVKAFADGAREGGLEF